MSQGVTTLAKAAYKLALFAAMAEEGGAPLGCCGCDLPVDYDEAKCCAKCDGPKHEECQDCTREREEFMPEWNDEPV